MSSPRLKEAVFSKTGSVSVENIDLDNRFEIGLGHLLNCPCSRIAIEGLSCSSDDVYFLESQSEVVVSDSPRVLGVAELANLILVADSIAGEPLPVCFEPGSDKDVPPLISGVVVGRARRDELPSHLDLWAGTAKVLENTSLSTRDL